MKKIFLLLIFVLSVQFLYPEKIEIKYKNFNLSEIIFTKFNNAFVIYDFIFPTLVRFLIIKENDSPKIKILKVIKYINFYSTPGRFERYKGLGSGGPWWKNPSLMLTSGYLLCSEQSSLATLILKSDFKRFALKDVTAHTFHEVLLHNRWIILDPLFDNRILNKYNQLVSFPDIQKYLNGDKTILKLPKNISERTKFYLNLFRKETYKPVRMRFDRHIILPIDNINLYLGLSVKKFLKFLKKYKINLNKKFVYGYLIFIRNNIIKVLKNNNMSMRNKLIYKIQDFFFKHISKEYLKGWIPENIDKLYIARNYQFLGRYKKAIEILNSINKNNKKIAFYKSQIFFKLKDKKNFNKFSLLLKDNIFYRYMYWLLNKKYLLKNDEQAFNKFRYKFFDYDKIILEKGKLIFN